MFRGMTIFKCDNCGHKFVAMDVEYMATIYSMPQPCPKCKSRHTMPMGLFSILNKRIYKVIWKKLDEGE